jgi:tRNA(Ile)-lysidine synthase
MALMHLLARLSRGWPLELSVAHLDHGLRRGSAGDRRFVETACRRLGLRCIADRRPVPALRRKEESPEEAARRVRRQFLLEAAKEAGAVRIATGHTLDDQAETVLMRLVRGAGPSALLGMAACGPGPFVRPLLGLERRELRAYLSRRGVSFREDPTNRELRFDRNRVRRLVVPVLRATLNPRAAAHLVAAAERLRLDAECLDEVARAALGRVARDVRGGGLSLDARGLVELHPAIGARVARMSLEAAGADPRRIASGHLDALLGLARGPSGKRVDLPTGVVAERRRDRVHLARR